jgi:hypothetical protein
MMSTHVRVVVEQAAVSALAPTTTDKETNRLKHEHVSYIDLKEDNAMKIPGGGELDPKIAALLAEDESPVFKANPGPKYAIFGRSTRLMGPNLLLTNRRLLIYKERLFRQRFDFAIRWSKRRLRRR